MSIICYIDDEEDRKFMRNLAIPTLKHAWVVLSSFGTKDTNYRLKAMLEENSPYAYKTDAVDFWQNKECFIEIVVNFLSGFFYLFEGLLFTISYGYLSTDLAFRFFLWSDKFKGD